MPLQPPNPPYPEASKSSYRADIDGLRGLQILALLGFHGFPTLITGGYTGVSIFFVISGYLITSIILKGLEKNKFNFLDFYIRRIRRIFPSLILIILFAFLLGYFLLLKDEYRQLGKYILGGSLFIDNFIAWQEVDYFDNAAELKPLIHLWSLGIEEQFYLFWPFILWLGWRLKKNLLTIIVFFTSLSFLLNIFGIYNWPVGNFYAPWSRFYEILSGGILAFLHLYPPQWSRKFLATYPSFKVRLENVAAGAGLTLILYGIFFLTRATPYPGWYGLIPVLGSILLIASGSSNVISKNILSNRLVIWFGLISYPLYLWHWMLLAFVRVISNSEPSWSIILSVLALSILFSWFSYRLIENPMRFGNHVLLKTFLLVISLIVLGALGSYTYLGPRILVWNQQNSEINQLLTRPNSIDYHNQICKKVLPQFNNLNSCYLSKPSQPTILVVGDSHAFSLREAFDKNYPDDSVLILAEWGCLPFATDQLQNTPGCRNKISDVLNFINSSTSIKKIYLVGFWGYLSSGGLSDISAKHRFPNTLTNDASFSFIKNAREVLGKITKSKNETILLKDIPILDFDIQNCFKLRKISIGNTEIKDCKLDKLTHDAKNDSYMKLMNTIIQEFPSIKTYDPKRIFEMDGSYIAKLNGLPLYYDSDHLNSLGADYLLKDLVASQPKLKH